MCDLSIHHRVRNDMTRVVGSVLLLTQVGLALAQTDEVRRLTQEPLTTQVSMRLLHLTQTGDRPTKLFLVQKWGELGPTASKHCERIAIERGVYPTKVKFPGLLADSLYQAALSPDPQIAQAAVRSLAGWGWDASRYLDRSWGGCGVSGSQLLPWKAHLRLQQLAKQRRQLVRSVFAEADFKAFDGIASCMRDTDPALLRQEARKRYLAASTEEERACAGYWYLLKPASLDSQILRAMDKEWRAEPPRWFRGFLLTSQGEKLLGKYTFPPKEKFEEPYAKLVERARTGSADLLAQVISEAKTQEDFTYAMTHLGDRALAEARGQEGEGLYKFWPESRPHVQRMLASERSVSRYVAYYVVSQIPKEKLESGVWADCLRRMVKDSNRFIDYWIDGLSFNVNDSDVQDMLIQLLQDDRESNLILKALDKVYDDRPADHFVRACSESSHPQIREYAQEILKQRYR